MTVNFADLMRARPTPRRAPYRDLLTAEPTAHTIDAARAYHDGVVALLTDGPRDGWTKADMASLYRLERRWRRRADGDDARWLLVGSKPGRLSPAVEKALRPTAADPRWTG
jgi:hypothetical protein